MESREFSGCNIEGGSDPLVCQEDLEGKEHHPNQGIQGVFMSSMMPSKYCRLVVVSLGILAVVLLVVDICLGVHYNNLTDTHFTPDDLQRIYGELIKLQDTYKTAVKTTKDAKKQLDNELSQQKHTNWEIEHQTKRSSNYEVQIEEMRNDINQMRSNLPMINDGCKYCPHGWILMNSLCYYFSSSSDPHKSWEVARKSCQLYGGDLAVVDSKDKQMSILNRLKGNEEAFFIGLKDWQKKGLWKWPNGTILVEGYWRDGEPNNKGVENCVTLYSNENIFKSWNDAPCSSLNKWICDKAPNL